MKKKNLLLWSIFMVALGGLGLSSARSPDSQRHGGTLVRLAKELSRSAHQFLASVEHATWRNHGLVSSAREFSGSADHFENALRRSNRGHVYEDFRRLRTLYHHTRDAFHNRNVFRHTDDQDYYRVVKSWSEVVYSYDQLSYAIERDGPDYYPPDDHSTDQIVRCKSEDYRLKECRVNGRIRQAYIDDQKSRAPCVEGRSFGFRGNTLWVDQGCDAKFRIITD